MNILAKAIWFPNRKKRKKKSNFLLDEEYKQLKLDNQKIITQIKTLELEIQDLEQIVTDLIKFKDDLIQQRKQKSQKVNLDSVSYGTKESQDKLLSKQLNVESFLTPGNNSLEIPQPIDRVQKVEEDKIVFVDEKSQRVVVNPQQKKAYEQHKGAK